MNEKLFFFLSFVLLFAGYMFQSVLHGKMHIKYLRAGKSCTLLWQKNHPCKCWKCLFCELLGQEHFSQMNICVMQIQKRQVSLHIHWNKYSSSSLSSPCWYKNQKKLTLLLNSSFNYSWRVLSLTCFHLWQPQVNLRLKFQFQSKMDPF